ncbi:hypothetical protein R2A130_2655 [Ahrensia sp. R2A130]|nr:hypothetical protein R2A130_2655 [Ahrensia sp. R2A130]
MEHSCAANLNFQSRLNETSETATECGKVVQLVFRLRQ